MEKKSIVMFTKKIGDSIRQNSPTILTGLSVAGLVTTTVMAVKATPKAIQILEERREEEKDLNEDFKDFTWEGVVKETWKCYIPAGLMGVATITCMICANSINLRRNAALASVYSLAETTLKEYQAKVVETIGEKEEQKIRHSIAQDKVNSMKPESIIITGSGDVLCLDLTSKRYFKSSYDKIKKVENQLGYELLNSMTLSLNEVYGMLNLEPTSVGWDIGWDVNRDGRVEIDITTSLGQNNEPCLVMDFSKQPRPLR